MHLLGKDKIQFENMESESAKKQQHLNIEKYRL